MIIIKEVPPLPLPSVAQLMLYAEEAAAMNKIMEGAYLPLLYRRKNRYRFAKIQRKVFLALIYVIRIPIIQNLCRHDTGYLLIPCPPVSFAGFAKPTTWQVMQPLLDHSGS